MATRTDRVDIAVAGAGIVGLATALAVRLDASGGTSVLVRDRALAAPPSPSLRAYAVSAGSRRLLQRLGVWDRIAPGAQPMDGMSLTDAPAGATLPPVFLRFDGEVAPREPFAHMVLHDPLRDALLDACREAGVALQPFAVTDFAVRGTAVVLDPGQPEEISASLLVAADGTRSRLRERAGIRRIGWDYGQTGIVATLAHERDHEGRATQHFLPGGPLALLPLRAPDGSGRRSSLVWTERQAEAERLLALPAALFVEALQDRTGNSRGGLRIEDRPSGHPLRLSLARSLVAERLALVGDAARTVHPLAGQGLNLGLADTAALARAVVGALDLGLDPGASGVLADYQRARRADGVALAATTDLLNRLFSNDSGPLRLLRDIGLGLVDRAPGLKQRLIRQAAGVEAPVRGRPRTSE